jgi:hypothetical protein
MLAAPAILGAATVPVPAQARGAEGAVDLLLILAVDASGSIDQDEFALQREGIAEAVAGWQRVSDAASAATAAAALRDAPRSVQSFNAIGDALVLSAALLAAAPWRAAERTIDVAGDGPDMRSLVPARAARDALVADGVVVNVLAIEAASSWRDGRLAELYERDVMGGPGAFVLRAEDRRDFARAMRAKLIREVAGMSGPVRG